jgi:hypothetical protein
MEKSTLPAVAHGTPDATRPRLGDLLRDLAADIGLGVAWAALVTVAVLFSGVVLQFAYVDF